MRKILLVVATVMCMGGAFAQLSMGPKLGLNCLFFDWRWIEFQSRNECGDLC